MPLQEPIAAYNAANNFEAHVICNILNDAGIDAYVTDDVSQVGVWVFGLLPEIHKPQIWIDRSNIERAKPILEDYERRLIERQEADRQKVVAGEATVEAKCEECGRLSIFPAAQEGTVQECSHCGAYLDVGDLPDSDEWWNEQEPTNGDDRA